VEQPRSFVNHGVADKGADPFCAARQRRRGPAAWRNQDAWDACCRLISTAQDSVAEAPASENQVCMLLLLVPWREEWFKRVLVERAGEALAMMADSRKHWGRDVYAVSTQQNPKWAESPMA